jgi:hypothetical protein
MTGREVAMIRSRFRMTMVVVLVLAGAAHGGQSSSPSSAQAAAFLGTWVFTMTNPLGAEETVRVWDKNGTVAASVQSGRFPAIEASGILEDGGMLVLTVRRFENGKPIRAVIMLTPDGEAMNLGQMLEFSQTIKRGTGKKQAR